MWGRWKGCLRRGVCVWWGCLQVLAIEMGYVVGVTDIHAGDNDGEQLFMHMLLRVCNGEQ